jgi:hypothetical protein
MVQMPLALLGLAGKVAPDENQQTNQEPSILKTRWTSRLSRML